MATFNGRKYTNAKQWRSEKMTEDIMPLKLILIRLHHILQYAYLEVKTNGLVFAEIKLFQENTKKKNCCNSALTHFKHFQQFLQNNRVSCVMFFLLNMIGIYVFVSNTRQNG